MKLDGNIDNREVPGIDTILGLYCTVGHILEHSQPLQNTESHIHCANAMDISHAMKQSFRSIYDLQYIYVLAYKWISEKGSVL